MKEKLMKETLSEFLGFLKYKVDNEILTLEEVQSIAMVVAENLRLSGTAQDFAGYFGQSLTNVRSVIKRHIPLTHERRVMYPFREFLTHIPKKWHHRHSLPAD